MERLRCPFCHDFLVADAPDRVVCVQCTADHHAECFAEHGNCAATACASPQALVGRVEVDATTLQTVARDPDALARLRASKPPPKRSLALTAVLALLIVVGFGVAWQIAGIAGLFVWTLVATLALPAFGNGNTDRIRVKFRDEVDYDPIFGVFRSGKWIAGVAPDHTEFLREKLAEGGRPGLPPGPLVTPTHCPQCEQPLEGGDEEDAPLAFCYHCGGDLALPNLSIRVDPEPDDPVGPERERA